MNLYLIDRILLQVSEIMWQSWNIFALCFEDWKAWLESNDLDFVIESFLSDDCMFLVIHSSLDSKLLKVWSANAIEVRTIELSF